MTDEEEKRAEDLARETDGFWKDPEKVLHLVDLIFLLEDGRETIPS